jgi:hypothetical protein
VTQAAIIAIAAAGVATLAFVGALLALRRTLAHAAALDAAIESGGRARFDAVVAQELELRATELERTLALARAESLSALAQAEREIAEKRRRDVAERERDATTRLGDALTTIQRGVDQRLADWTSDLEKLQAQVAEELQRITQRQEQLTAEIEKKLVEEGDRLQTTIDEHRGLIGSARDELQRTARELVRTAASELEQHATDRRRALHEVGERLQKREHDLQARIELEQAEAVQRIAVGLAEVEQRQIEAVRRVVSRETTRYAETAAQSFDTTIRTAREEAARRLRRELDLSIERFSREADGVLAERVEQIAQRAVQQVEAGIRARLSGIASEAEAERELLDRRLTDLMRRIEELTPRT